MPDHYHSYNTLLTLVSSVEGPWRESFTKRVLDESGAGSSNPGLEELETEDNEVDEVLSMDIALDSICLSPCFPTTPSSFTRKLKR